MKKKFRKLSTSPFKEEDHVGKLEYLFSNKNTFSLRSTSPASKRTRIVKNVAEGLNLARSIKITEVNDANLKALFKLYRKKFN